MLVRRWVLELTFKNPEQRVVAAGREALRCDLNRSATGTALPLSWGVLRRLSTAHQCIWIRV